MVCSVTALKKNNNENTSPTYRTTIDDGFPDWVQGKILKNPKRYQMRKRRLPRDGRNSSLTMWRTRRNRARGRVSRGSDKATIDSVGREEAIL